jgi:flagellar basal body-associated protein FliL
MKTKIKSIIITIVVIVLAAVLIYIMYFMKTPVNIKLEENQNLEETLNNENATDTSPEPLPMTQVYFNESLSTEPQGAKSQVVHGVIFPVLKMIFNLAPANPEEIIIDNVKLNIFFDDNKLVYVFNRTCTDEDIENFKIALKTMGAKIKNESNPITAEYSSMNFTFNFWLNDQQKSGVEVSF